MLHAVIFVIFPFCMVFAAVSDLLSMTIANRVSLILVATFAAAAPLTGMDWTAYAWHWAAGLGMLAVTFTLFAVGGMGGGDAKLIAATALWMGAGVELMQYLVTGAMIGGALTLALMAFRGSPVALLAGTSPRLRHLADDKAGIPYGAALGAAGLITFPDTALMVWARATLVF
ncbi:MAG TPA: prepilin peptidase [Mesorhizobium sp.]|jgi:prepilin peptidase CpaA|nr:prepilin peptidase [Mesorhizobium sp.]